MITAEQLKDIKERTEALNRYLDIEGKKIQVEEEQLRTQAPGFWDDQKAAEAQMKNCLLYTSPSPRPEGCRGSDEESERLAAMDFRLQ